MFYRVLANLVFTEEDEANDFYHDCKVALPKSVVINLGEPQQEPSTISIHKCFHDETPPKECEIIDEQTLTP